MAKAKEKGQGEEGRTGVDTVATDIWVLATINSWVKDGRSKEETVAKIMKSFGLKELWDAAGVLRKGEWCVPQISLSRESAAGPDYCRRLAEKVYDGLVSIQNHAVNVHFWVSSHDLLKVPGSRQHFEDHLDED